MTRKFVLLFLLAASPALAADIVFPDAQTTQYEVKKGDNLTRIAKIHHVTPGLIRKVNGLPGDRLSVGEKLRIPAYALSVTIDKSDNTLVLKGGESVLKTYTVSTGAQATPTPVGTFQVTDKLENPTWYKAGAVIPPGSSDNQLGTRWLGISAKGYGIHGTTEPEKLGLPVSAGCIRMKNEDVEELYSLVPPGAAVTIQE